MTIRIVALTLFLIPIIGITKDHQYDRGTDKKPVIVQEQTPVTVNPVTINGDVTTHQQPPTDEEKKHVKDRDDDDHLTAVSTKGLEGWTLLLVLVGLSQLFMFAVQLWFTRKAFDDAKTAAETAKKAADAAKQSADTAQKTERAWLIVKIELVELGVYRAGNGVRGRVIVMNQGRTPAILRMFRGYLVPANAMPTELFQHEDAMNQMPMGLAVGANNSIEFELTAALTEDQIRNIQGINIGLFAVGLVNYDDVMGVNHETGYCWMTQSRNDQMGFHIAPSALNYIK